MSICLGYDDSNARDGAGSQLQKVVGIFGLSKKFNLGFFFAGFNQIESNPGDGVNSRKDYLKLIDELNCTFNFRNEICNRQHVTNVLPFSRMFAWDWSTRVWFLLHGMRNKIKKKHQLYLLNSPYYFVERDPSIYQYFSRCFQREKEKKLELSIQLHILGAKNSQTMMKERFLNLDWYKRNLQVITSELETVGAQYQITIHTDSSAAQKEWQPQAPLTQATKNYWENGGLINANGKIILNAIDIEKEFSSFLNVKIVRDVAPTKAWEVMSKSDIFIGAKSSFSIIGALLSSPYLVIFPKFQHNLPDGWLIVDEAHTVSRTYVQKLVYHNAMQISNPDISK